eukprot:2392085-Prymnesium_polylepis.1
MAASVAAGHSWAHTATLTFAFRGEKKRALSGTMAARAARAPAHTSVCHVVCAPRRAHNMAHR